MSCVAPVLWLTPGRAAWGPSASLPAAYPFYWDIVVNHGIYDWLPYYPAGPEESQEKKTQYAMLFAFGAGRAMVVFDFLGRAWPP